MATPGGAPSVISVWASPREKLDLLGKDLDEYSLETVRMFHADALAAGYKL